MVSALLNNLKEYWNCDEGSGNIILGNYGTTLSGNYYELYWVTGKINTGVYLGNDYFPYTDSLNVGTDKKSFSFWGNIEWGDDYSGMFMYGEYSSTIQNFIMLGFEYIEDDLVLVLYVRKDINNFDYYIVDSVNNIGYYQWNHFVVVLDGITKKVYINGVEKTLTSYVSLGTVNSFDIANNQPFYLGGSIIETYPNWFYGVIDEFGIWDRALTQTDIDELYNSGNGFAPPAPYTSEIISKSFAEDIFTSTYNIYKTAQITMNGINLDKLRFYIGENNGSSITYKEIEMTGNSSEMASEPITLNGTNKYGLNWKALYIEE